MKPKERPILENIVKDDTLEIESFQNKTLRPIIKMQHEILTACFNNYLEEKKIKLLDLSVSQKLNKIKSILIKDNSFKKLIFGVIIAHFSLSELSFYFKNKREVHRRITNITIQRLQDTLIHKK